jgi:phosphopantothenoylcysteine decarboxylase/phosphopantothenate--cysteine ligase
LTPVREKVAVSERPCRTLLLGLTGSVGVLIVPHYIYLLRQLFADRVVVMMSESAQRFVSPYTFRLFSGSTVFTDSFDITDDVRVPHIELTREADLLVVMPATANIVGKVASGICDDLISTAAAACEAPVVFVPSMNPSLWENPIVRHNVRKLRRVGHRVLEPGYGYEIADMKRTYGVMPSFETILEELRSIMAARSNEAPVPDAP